VDLGCALVLADRRDLGFITQSLGRLVRADRGGCGSPDKAGSRSEYRQTGRADRRVGTDRGECSGKLAVVSHDRKERYR
jgi:hypothetical protein